MFTSNVFALLGLQQLYFCLARVARQAGLPLGLSVVLGFIGVKLIGGHARQFPAVRQRRKARSLGSGSADMAVLGRDRRGYGGSRWPVC